MDTGGTFTDCLALDSSGNLHRQKVLSSSRIRAALRGQPDSTTLIIDEDWRAPRADLTGFSVYSGGATVGTVRSYDRSSGKVTLEEASRELSSGTTLEFSTGEEAPVLAARLITGTPVGKSLPVEFIRLATTRGTNALLERKIARTSLITNRGHQDVLRIGDQRRPDLFALHIEKPEPLHHFVEPVCGRINASGEEIEPVDPGEIRSIARRMRNNGVEACTISLLNSYLNPEHENHIARLLREEGIEWAFPSSGLSAYAGFIPRTETAVINAALAPVIVRYLRGIAEVSGGGRLQVMTSAGNLMDHSSYQPKDSLLSGPAGGVVGASTVGHQCGTRRIISFDMGGTSTDVAMYDGKTDYQFEHTVGQARVMAPAIRIETVAAGGGSICSFDGYKLSVGPESAGADPGPACYGNGGPLTVTDVNLLSGRITPDNFSIPVDIQAAESALDHLITQMEDQAAPPGQILASLRDIADERMAEAIKVVSVKRGLDPSGYALTAFGGAGGQHACSIARKLGIPEVIFPADAGLLSAFGLQNARIERFAERQLDLPVHDGSGELHRCIQQLESEALEKLQHEGIDRQEAEITRRILTIRLQGQESGMHIDIYPGDDIAKHFLDAYQQRYGYRPSNKGIEVVSVRTVASEIKAESSGEKSVKSPYQPEVDHYTVTYINNEKAEVPVYDRSTLKPGAEVEGPALLLDPHSTVFLEPGWHFELDGNGHGIAKETEQAVVELNQRPEAARLELFTNRFQSIASEMGEMLQRTAISVNVKERLDFSCAILDAEGKLVANAPHIPVHLGALGTCVRSVVQELELREGDVAITNHPAYGGSHLPDVTVIAPVYHNKELLGYVANRCHHAELGGKQPGSMPADATNLEEEGVVIPPQYLIRRGKEQWEAIRLVLSENRWPSRSVEDNLADLHAAVAACNRGIKGLQKLCAEFSSGEVQESMLGLTHYAEHKMRERIRQMVDGTFQGRELLDDGTVLSVIVTISGEGLAIDFSGTSEVHPGNLNATPAIVNSAVVYLMRLLVNEPLPLNDGLLAPVQLHLPEGILNPVFHSDPAKSPAVVGGNVETSQRLVDTLLKPFGLMACSQGTMNNLLFGDDKFGFYETICGGTGAGRDFHGTDAVHHHMTNTRITDPEIMEYRYPVRVLRFEIRPDSGGKGRCRGGNGVIRELEFLKSLKVSLLSQHRVEWPYGLAGGGSGAPGEQYLLRADGSHQPLPGSTNIQIEKDDRLCFPEAGVLGPVSEERLFAYCVAGRQVSWVYLWFNPGTIARFGWCGGCGRGWDGLSGRCRRRAVWPFGYVVWHHRRLLASGGYRPEEAFARIAPMPDPESPLLQWIV